MVERLNQEIIRQYAPHMPDDKVSDLVEGSELSWSSYKGYAEQDIFNQRFAMITRRVFRSMGRRAEAYLNDLKPMVEAAALYFKEEVLDGGNLGGLIAKGDNVFDVRLVDTKSVLDGNVSTSRQVSATAGTAFDLIPNDTSNHKYEMGDGTTKKQEWLVAGFYDPLGAENPAIEQIQIDIDDSSLARQPLGVYEQQLTEYPFAELPFMWVQHNSGIDWDNYPVLSQTTRGFPVAVEILTADQISDLI